MIAPRNTELARIARARSDLDDMVRSTANHHDTESLARIAEILTAAKDEIRRMYNAAPEPTFTITAAGRNALQAEEPTT